jgi:hypothetical protein
MAGRFLGIALALSLVLPATAGGSVAYVGDSLGVGTVPYLRGELNGVAIDDDSDIGRPSGVGVAVLESMLTAEHEVVVFDLGTNDDPSAPDMLATDLAAARSIAGPRCMVIATLNRPPLNGVPVDGLNRAVRSFAAADGNVALVDWHARAQTQPSLLIDDGVHPSPDGYALRAQLFAKAITSCGSGSPGGGGGQRPERDHPDADRSDLIDIPEPKPGRKPAGPVRVVAGEVAKSVAVGADFG